MVKVTVLYLFCNKLLPNFSNLHKNDLCISNHLKFIIMPITEINLLVQQRSVTCPKNIFLCIALKYLNFITVKFMCCWNKTRNSVLLLLGYQQKFA